MEYYNMQICFFFFFQGCVSEIRVNSGKFSIVCVLKTTWLSKLSAIS
jgi:hypothetical protein